MENINIQICKDGPDRTGLSLDMSEADIRCLDIASLTGQWIWEVDSEGRYIYASPSVKDILGYKPEEVIGKYIYDLFRKENREEMKQTFFEVFSRQKPFRNFLNKLIHKNGSEVYLEASGAPLIRSDGQLCGYRGADRDVTSRIEIEHCLRMDHLKMSVRHEHLDKLFRKVETAKKELEKTIDCLGDMIILTDDQGKIKRSNKAFMAFTGQAYSDVIGRDWEDIINEYGLEAITFYSSAVELVHKSSQRWFQMNDTPFKEVINGFSGHIITLYETTEVKNITLELVKSNQTMDDNSRKLQGALDQISTLIESVIEGGFDSVKFFNPNLVKCYELKACAKEDCACFGKEAMRCWKAAGTYCGGEVQGTFAQKYKNCSECEVYREATSDPIYQIGEQFNNMMHLLEMKNSELAGAYDELKASHAQMLHQEKMASIGQLAAGVAHEINNPTGFIACNIGTLGKYINKLSEFIQAQSKVIGSLKAEDISIELKNIRGKLKIDYVLADVEELIRESIEGADRIKKIVQNLKSFSRLDEADYKHADINECIESTLNIVWNELKYKATVEKEYGNIHLTKCFPQQLNQVFMNLLVNAGHAIEKQGEIKIKTWEENNTIFIAISDTGSGIPKDKISRIFEPFFTTKEVGKGTGLGLSISYDIVKKHNGVITVESEVGSGSLFTIKLPVVEGK